MDKPAQDLDPADVNHLLNLLAKLQTAAEQRRKTGALNQGRLMP